MEQKRSYHIVALLLLSLLLLVGNSHAVLFTENDLLENQVAFKVKVLEVKDNQILLGWEIADDYYMYKDKFSYQIMPEDRVRLTSVEKSPGKPKQDPFFGDTEVHTINAFSTLHLIRSDSAPVEVTINANGQGCNDPIGVCYPPVSHTLKFSMAGLSLPTDTVPNQRLNSDDELTPWRVASLLLIAFAGGLALTFTPCVLPMVPILAGIIQGQKSKSVRESGFLSISYVLGTITTYTLVGVFAGYSGQQLQAYFQSPYWIFALAALFLAMAAAMFGWFRIQLSGNAVVRLQNLIFSKSQKETSPKAYLLVFSMGMFSALIIGACVSPVFISALALAIDLQSPWLGGAIMFALATGMGCLLIAFGFGAGAWLPKSGPWMQWCNILLGFLLLATAIYVLEAVPGLPTWLLWGFLLIGIGTTLIIRAGAILRKRWQSWLLRTSAMIAILYGLLLTLSAFNHELRQLLSRSGSYQTASDGASIDSKSAAKYRYIGNLSQMQQELAAAKANLQPVMIYFTAEWCVDCRRFVSETLSDPEIIAAMEEVALLKVDLTDPRDKDTASIQQHFQVFGPPATLFIDRAGRLLSAQSRYGFMDADSLLEQLNSL